MMILKYGSHKPNDDGDHCLLEAVSVVKGVEWSDRPKGVCPVLSAFGRALNDRIKNDDERTRLLGRFVDLIANAPTSRELQQRRAFIAADYACRVFAPLYLDAQGRTEDAAALRALAPIVDVTTALIAKKTAAAAAAAAYAAGAAAAYDAYAAYAAAADAAYTAAATAAAAAYAAYAADAIECLEKMCSVS